MRRFYRVLLQLSTDKNHQSAAMQSMSVAEQLMNCAEPAVLSAARLLETFPQLTISGVCAAYSCISLAATPTLQLHQPC